MKSGINLLLMGLALLLAACQRNEINESKPLIKSISFIGIPDKDVTLDEKYHQITIKVPALLPKEGLIPKIETSHGTTITQGLTPEGKLDLTPFCTCFGYGNNPHPGMVESRLVLGYKNKVTGDELTSTYRVILSSPKGRRIEPIENLPITYSEKIFSALPGFDSLYINIHLPVRNLYQNHYVSAIFFKNIRTGSKAGYNMTGPDCINACEDPRANYMTVVYRTDYGEKLTPGTYEVSIRTSWDQEMIVFPQPFVFNR